MIDPRGGGGRLNGYASVPHDVVGIVYYSFASRSCHVVNCALAVEERWVRRTLSVILCNYVHWRFLVWK